MATVGVRVRLHGEKVQMLREQAGLSRAELAEKVGTSRPTIHRYEQNKRGVSPSVALVWSLSGRSSTALHAGTGVIMQLYCLARRAAGRMTARYDIDIHNVALFWHFVALTAVVTVAVIAGFPWVA